LISYLVLDAFQFFRCDFGSGNLLRRLEGLRFRWHVDNVMLGCCELRINESKRSLKSVAFDCCEVECLITTQESGTSTADSRVFLSCGVRDILHAVYGVLEVTFTVWLAERWKRVCHRSIVHERDGGSHPGLDMLGTYALQGIPDYSLCSFRFTRLTIAARVTVQKTGSFKPLFGWESLTIE
jgi:hypothetical protein